MIVRSVLPELIITFYFFLIYSDEILHSEDGQCCSNAIEAEGLDSKRLAPTPKLIYHGCNGYYLKDHEQDD
jgi:hypothetical protein